MGRIRRIHHPDCLVEINQSCHNGKGLLASAPSRDLYLSLLRLQAEKLGYQIVRTCILDDRIKLVLRTPAEIKGRTISHFMHRLNTAFGKRYNKLHRRQGTVWGGRFHCRWLLDGQLPASWPATSSESSPDVLASRAEHRHSAIELQELKLVEEALARGEIPPTPGWGMLMELCARLVASR